MGIFVDSDLVMRTHVTMCQTVSRCFAELRQPRSIRYLVSLTVFQSLLVTASVLSRLDYGLPAYIAYLIRRLQSVQNAATRLIFRLRRCDHVTDALVSLHWLRVSERIVFKVAVQTLDGDASQYLQQFTCTADIPSRHKLRSSVTDSLFVPAVRLSTVGRRAFPVAGARIWNDLPSDVTSSPPLFTFN